MFARYDQDLTPYFERIQAQRMARREAQRQRLRDGWAALRSYFGPARRG